MAMNTLPNLLRRRMASDATRTIMRRKDRGIWKPMSWGELGAGVRSLVRAMQTDGFGQGMTGAILADTHPEWLQADLALQSAGGLSAGMSPLAGVDDIAMQLRASDARLLFVENEEQLDKVLEARTACQALRRIVIFDMKGLRGLDDPMCTSFADYMRGGANTADAWDVTIDALDPDAPAVLVYTHDCPVRLTHRSLAATIEAAARLFAPNATDERLAVMPLPHVSERVLGAYLSLHTGCISNFGESAGTLEENLREVKPTLLVAAPLLWKRFHDRIVLAAGAATHIQRLMFRTAFAAAAAGCDNRANASRAVRWSAAAAWLAWPVLANVRRELGLSRLRLGLIAGGTATREMVRWFMALGIDPIEVYGPAESGGLAAAPTPGAVQPGDVGYPIAPDLLRITPDGEIELNSAALHQPDAESQSNAVWRRTGDAGVITDGRLTVVGRAADAITLRDGSAVHPEPIERALCLSPYIADAVVVGDGQAFPGCLLLLEADAAEGWAHAKRVPFSSFADLANTAELRSLLLAEIDRVNKTAARASPIRAFRAIDRRLQEGDPELTSLGGLRRAAAVTTFRSLITAMYDEGSHSAPSPIGQAAA
jgi:long-chain acyl-CoA synthetase